MSAKTYLRILQGGLIASLLIVFFVFSDLLFPFITSKQLSFNVLMEILFVIWLVFIMRYPAYRPKKSYITWGLAAYFLAILASCAVSVNFTLSFWGNAERMLGLFHLIHFLIFYLILITVFRSWKEWRLLFQVSLVVAVIVSFIGLNGANVYSTIGNTAYVSGYLIFNLFFGLLLFLRSEHKGWRWIYAPAALIMLDEFWSCHTSGAIIGLFLSILLLFFLLGITHRNKTLRRSALIVLILAVLGVAALFAQYQHHWFQNSFLRNLTPEKATFQTRLISWKSAWDDFPSHPIFGTGFGNYAIIFDKHFDPKFFNYATTDTYFDRAHDNLIDIASTTGLVGLLTYLSIFAAVIYYLVKKFKANGGQAGSSDEGSRSNLEIIVIFALLTAYFIQNLAVFDSLVTYVGLMIILGFIYWLVQSAPEKTGAENYRLTLSARLEWPVLIVLLIGAYIFTSYYNLRPWRMFQGVIVGYSDIAAGNFQTGVQAYQKALIGTPLDHDGRVTLINLLTSNPNLLENLPADQAAADLTYVIDLAQQNVNNNPLDSLNQLQLAQVYDTAARYYGLSNDMTKFNEYSSQGMIAIERSLESSPGRAPVYLIKAQMQLGREETAQALATVKYAISLNTDYYEGYCRLAQFYFFIQNQPKNATSTAGIMVSNKDISSAIDSCVDLGGSGSINSSNLLISSLNYLVGQKDYVRSLKLAQRLADLNTDNAQIWLNLGKLYMISGDATDAQAAATKAIGLQASLGTDWNNFMTSFAGTATTSGTKSK